MWSVTSLPALVRSMVFGGDSPVAVGKKLLPIREESNPAVAENRSLLAELAHGHTLLGRPDG